MEREKISITQPLAGGCLCFKVWIIINYNPDGLDRFTNIQNIWNRERPKYRSAQGKAQLTAVLNESHS